jgi:hypothetical protein
VSEGGDSSGLIPGLPSVEQADAEGPPIDCIDKGTREAAIFASGAPEEDIKKKALTAEAERTEKFRDHYEKVAICALWIVSALFLVVVLIWFYHIVMPDGWQWLPPDHIARLQSLMTGGVLASLAGTHMKKRLGV